MPAVCTFDGDQTLFQLEVNKQEHSNHTNTTMSVPSLHAIFECGKVCHNVVETTLRNSTLELPKRAIISSLIYRGWKFVTCSNRSGFACEGAAVRLDVGSSMAQVLAWLEQMARQVYRMRCLLYTSPSPRDRG
eukprot:761524-Amphidinium_carterae.1